MKKNLTLSILTILIATTLTACHFGNEEQVTDEEIGQGWYYAQEDERKEGTPEEWTFLEDGESSKWIKPPVESMLDY
jgi:hypothetical protein